MTKILFDARYLDHSGIGTYSKIFIQICIQQQSLCKNFAFLFNKKDKNLQLVQTLIQKNFPVYFIYSKPFNILEHIELYFALLTIKPDYFHIPHFNMPILKPKYVKLTSTIHDLALDLLPMERKTIFHYVYYKHQIKLALQADKIIAVSEYTKNCIENIYKQYKTIMIYNGFIPHVKKINPKNRSSDFLYVGINKPRKNLKFLLTVFEKLPNNYKLIIVGNMKNAKFNIYKEIKQKKLEHKIKILGVISEQQLYFLYQSVKALILPSLLEGFGFPILEAAQYYLPVIASKTGSFPEIGGDGCLYFDPTDINDAISVIKSLDKLKIKQITNINYERLKIFDAQIFIQKILNLYNLNYKVS